MRKLLVVPDLRLRQKSEPVKSIDAYVKELAQEMLMRLSPMKAVGFSAVQFGELIRLIVVRVRGLEVVLVNPEIVKQVGEHVVREGCKSVPGKLFAVKRPKIVKVRGLNLDGQVKAVKGRDFLAQALAHEVDHCDGVMIDKIGRFIGSMKEGRND